MSIRRSKLEFCGSIFMGNGLRPSLDEVKAIRECSPPGKKDVVRSSLRMTGYLSKFVTQYSSITTPLFELTREKTRFRWTNVEESVFNKTKECISDETTIAYLKPDREITVRAEASFHDGLSGGLFQPTDDGLGLQPVHFISRTMTDTERLYSQPEKDTLAVKWCKERLSMYLRYLRSTGLHHFT